MRFRNRKNPLIGHCVAVCPAESDLKSSFIPPPLPSPPLPGGGGEGGGRAGGRWQRIQSDMWCNYFFFFSASHRPRVGGHLRRPTSVSNSFYFILFLFELVLFCCLFGLVLFVLAWLLLFFTTFVNYYLRALSDIIIINVIFLFSVHVHNTMTLKNTVSFILSTF